MTQSKKDQLAEKVNKAWSVLGAALFHKGNYPRTEFYAFFDAVMEYDAAIKGDKFIHRSIAGMISRLVDTLEMERTRVPKSILADADRLECLIFPGYDPSSEGDAPADR